MDQLPDSALVDLAKAGDQLAFAELYTRWFDAVYDFLARMVRNRAEAADVAHDSFLKAMHALAGLQPGISFKSWIFTIARNTALQRVEQPGRTRLLALEDGEGEEDSLCMVETGRFESPEAAAAADAIAARVWEASAALDPRQLSLLDLHLRHGLDSADLAAVLGVRRNNADVMLSRLTTAVNDAIGVFIIFSDGRRACDDLDALLSVSSGDGMSPDVRKLIDGHVTRCEACDERKQNLISPLAVFSAFVAVGVPPGTREHGLERLACEWPGAVGLSSASLPPPPEDGLGSLPGGHDGNAPFFQRLGKGKTTAMLGGAAALFLFGLFIFPVLGSGGDGRDATQTDPTDDAPGNPLAGIPTPTPTATRPAATPRRTVTPIGTSPAPTATTAAPVATAPSGQVTAPPTHTVGPDTPTATSTGTPTATATATLTPTPTSTQIPCSPSLSTNTGTLNVPPGNTSSFLLLTSCGSADYTVSGGAGWATTSPAGGNVSFGSPQTVVVSVDVLGLGEGAHSAVLAIAGPENTAFVTVNTSVGGESPSIASFLATCSDGSTSVTFTASITDDIAVTSVSVAYTISPSDDVRSVELEQSGDIWSATVTLDAPSESVSSATLTAVDGAGHTDTASDSNGCGS